MTLLLAQQERFGRFELRGFLGRGASGDVHLAFDPKRQREVALKLVRKEAVDDDVLEAERKGAELQRRVAEEAPEVAAVFEYGDLDGYFYIAMEYVEGEDLAKVLAAAVHEPLEARRAVRIGVQLCEVLESLHRFSTRIEDKEIRTIVHGDLKPENIRLEASDRVRLVDFGIAKHLTLTRQATRNLFGTYPYTPPERLRSGLVDAKSDLWAVGIILYLMVSGQQPYPGASAEELERMIVSRPPSPLPERCPPRLREVLERCLAFDAAKRYESAAELRHRLEELLAEPGALGTGPLGISSAATASEPAVSARALTRTEGATQRTATPPGATRRTGEGVAAGHTVRTLGPVTSAPTARSTPTAGPQALEPAGSTDPAADAADGRPLLPPPLPSSQEAQPASTVGERGPAGRLPAWLSRRPRTLAIVAMLFLFVQVCAQRSARDIVETVTRESTPDAYAEFQHYRRLAAVVPFDIGLGRARREVRTALVEEAERVLHGFRQDIPSTRLADWEDANRCVRAAVILGANDAGTRAKVHYTQAHIDRIQAKNLEDRDPEAAERLWSDAVFGFHQAAELAPEWADPYLGLARIYAYEHFDLVKLLDALRSARSRGVPWGKRELAQLADANRAEGMRLTAQADDLSGEPGELQLLYDARRHLESAVAGYEQILSFGNAKQNRDFALKKLAAINGRVRELHGVL